MTLSVRAGVKSMRSSLCRSIPMALRFAGAAVLLIAGFAVQPPTRAQEVHAAVGAVTDYVVHGLTRSRSDPALQGELVLSWAGGTSLGAWASTVNLNPGPGANAEYTPFASHRFRAGMDFAVDARIARYIYPDDPDVLDYDYTEMHAALVYRDSIALAVSYSPDWSMYTREGPSRNRRAIWTDLSAAWPVGPSLSLNGGIGYADLSDHDSGDYTYYSAGVEWRWRQLLFGVVYVGTDNDAERLFTSDNAGDRVVGSLMWAIR